MAMNRDPANGSVSHLDKERRRHLYSGFNVRGIFPCCGISDRLHLHHLKVKDRSIHLQKSNVSTASLHFLYPVSRMIELILFLLMIAFIYYAARWIPGRSPLYCETCHLNTYVDASGWCHNCSRILKRRCLLI